MQKNSEIMHNFVHQKKPHQVKGNIFYEQNKIYSYGYHYLLGCILNDNYLFINTSGYSATTAQHISQLRSANNRQAISSDIKSLSIILKDNFNSAINIKDYFMYLNNYISNLLIDISKRKPTSFAFKDKLNSINNELKTFFVINDLLQKNELYIREMQDNYRKTVKSLFKKEANKLKNLQQKIDNDLQAILSKHKTALDKQKAKEKIAKTTLKKTYDKDLLKIFTEYQAGVNDNISSFFRKYDGVADCNALLKIENNQVVTSKGVRISLESAKAFYANYTQALKNNTAIDNVKIDGWIIERVNLNTGQVKAGCHTLNRFNIDIIGKML